MNQAVNFKGIKNQVISDIKQIREDQSFHFSVAEELESGRLPMHSVLDKFSVIASIGYLGSLDDQRRKEVLQSPELDDDDRETFRKYVDKLDKQGITGKLAHAYPQLFEDAVQRPLFPKNCTLSLGAEKGGFFFARTWEGETTTTPLDRELLKSLGNRYLQLMDMRPQGMSPGNDSPGKEIKELGRRLFGLFLDDGILEAGLQRLYIEISTGIEDPGARRVLEMLPFEVLYSETYHFLTLNRRIPIIRRFPGIPAGETEAIRYPFKLLVIISNPPGLPEEQKINVEREKRVFYKALDPLVYEGKLEIDVIDMATRGRISDKLRKDRFHAVHFLGHGLEQGIVLEDEAGETDMVPGERFAALFSAGGVGMFFLTSCLTDVNEPENRFSSTVRELRKCGIPVVVGMRRPLTVGAAEILVREFYAAFFDFRRHSLTAAFTAALDRVWDAPHPLVSSNAFIPALYIGGEDGGLQWQEEIEPGTTAFRFLDPLRIHTTGCYGREKQLREAKKALENPNHRVLVVTGIGGIGKSAFIYRLLRDRYSDYFAYFVKVFRTETVDKGYDIHRFFREFGDFLGQLGEPDLQRMVAAGKENYSAETICRSIGEVVERRRLMVVLENLEQLLERDDKGKFHFMDDGFPGLLEAVMRGTSGIRLLVGTRAQFQCLAFEENPALKHEILLSTLDTEVYSREIAREIDPGMKDKKMGALSAHAGGYPLLVQWMSNPSVTVPEMEDLDFEALPDAAGGEKILGILEHMDRHLDKDERHGLYCLSQVFLPFDRELIERFTSKGTARKLVRLPFFRRVRELFFELPDIISRYVIDTHGPGYDKRARKKIHNTAASYYHDVLEKAHSKGCPDGDWRRYIVFSGSHIPAPLVKAVAFHYLEAANYRKARDLVMKYFQPLQDTGEALFLEQVLTVFRKKMKAPGPGVAFKLAKVSDELYHYDRALELYKDVLEVAEDAYDKAATCHQIGISYHRKGQFEEAIHWYRTSMEIKKEIDDKKGLAYSMHQVGMAYEAMHDYAPALQWYHKAVTVFEQIGEQNELGNTYRQMGILYYLKGDYDAALEWTQRSMDASKDPKYIKELSFSAHQMGILYQKKRNFMEAFVWYQKSALVKNVLGDKKGLANTYGQIGIMFEDEGNFQEAIDWYKKSLAIYEEIGDKGGLAMMYYQMGISLCEKKDYETAMHYNRLSMELSESIGGEEKLAKTYHQMGILYLQAEDYDTAITWGEKCALSLEKLGDMDGLAGAYHQLGIAHQKKKEFDTAFQYYRRSYDIRKERKNFSGMSLTLAQLSLFYLEVEQYKDAFTHILSAMTYAEAHAPHLLERLKRTLASIYRQLGEEKAQEILDSL